MSRFGIYWLSDQNLAAMPSFADDSNADLLVYMSMVRDDRVNARAAFAEFYGRHVDWVCAIVKRLPAIRMVSPADAADIVQDTFLHAYNGASTFIPKAAANSDSERRRVRAWLGGIAKKVILQHLVGLGLLAGVEEIDVEAASAADCSTGAASALVLKARDELDRLDERDKDIVLSWLYEYKPGSKNQRISNAGSQALAARWNTSPENIRQRRKRIFDQLRATLQPGQVALEKCE
jgi:DNA-directed RNA polymerase specialized sigma24 family protein